MSKRIKNLWIVHQFSKSFYFEDLCNHNLFCISVLRENSFVELIGQLSHNKKPVVLQQNGSWYQSQVLVTPSCDTA